MPRSRLLHRTVATAASLVALLAMTASSAPAATKTLTVTIADAGAQEDGPAGGRVTSQPAGIDCPATCAAPFEQGTSVTLTASPNRGFALAEWNALPNDDRCSQTPACTVTIGATELAVDARFQGAAQLDVMPAGHGTVSVSPVAPGVSDTCAVDAQLIAPGATCSHRYATGTRVTLTAKPAAGATFVGWSDFACTRASRRCTITLQAGVRYLKARFSPVTLAIQQGDFGAVTVSPKPGGLCTFLAGTPPCRFHFPAGTLVTLRRERRAAGRFWAGGCAGNRAGALNADVCRLRLQGDELVGAGLTDPAPIPPPLGSGITIQVVGTTRGKVTGKVDGGSATLNCVSKCSISGLTVYDVVRVKATPKKGSRFVTWSDGSKLKQRSLQLSKVNRIKATFAKKR